jgi:hypothetical protein
MDWTESRQSPNEFQISRQQNKKINVNGIQNRRKFSSKGMPNRFKLNSIRVKLTKTEYKIDDKWNKMDNNGTENRGQKCPTLRVGNN